MKKVTKVVFKNAQGQKLIGRIELPDNQPPHNFAVFAHCFTCSKNLNAAINITRALAEAGIGVLRFDFTGLGESEGDFADTNFSGNVGDLIEAANFLRDNYQAPSLLVGHSLGGSAVIFAAEKLSYVKAVATIGAPSDPSHVRNLLKDSEEEIIKNGKATVALEGRPFTIKKQFLDDLSNNHLAGVVNTFGRALAIFHSPQDKIVNFKNAEDIYRNAQHPKNIISLSGADHLLTDRKDAHYVGALIAGWATRYVDIPDDKDIQSTSRSAASLNDADGYSTKLKLGTHQYLVDEPEEVGGNDFGPNPYDLLSGSLAACKAMTVQMYARRKNWKVENITVNIDYSKIHARDCEDCENNPAAKIDSFTCEISLAGNLTTEQKVKLLEIADRCPVHRTLTGHVQIKSRLNE